MDTSHLDIEYRDPPGRGDLPDMPHSPCSDEFEEDAFTGVPQPCAGNEQLQQEFEHGLITECECSAEPPTAAEVGFPYELGPFLMFDTGYTLNSLTDGFALTNDGWSAVFEGTTYTGRCSPFAAVTLPDLDEAFGLEGEDVVSQVAWCYANSEQYQAALAASGTEHTETMGRRFLSRGGFAYTNAAGAVVALKEIAPADAALTVPESAQLTLKFDQPQGITQDQANHACPGGFEPVTRQELLDAGALEYCWDKSGTLSFCTHGCFTYHTDSETSLGYIAFPVVESTAHLAPAHYAPTDQQGAEVASMITGMLAATNPPSEA